MELHQNQNQDSAPEQSGQVQTPIRRDGTRGALPVIIGMIIVVAIILGIYALTRHAARQDGLPDAVGLDNRQGAMAADGTYLGAGTVATLASVTGLDIVNLQTFPYQIQARVTVALPDGCSTPTTHIARSENVFTVTVAASRRSDQACTAMPTSSRLTLDVPVAGLSAGTYTVKAGDLSQTFTLAQDNRVEYTNDK